MSRLNKKLHGEFHNDVLEKAEQNEAICQYLAPQLQEYRAAVAAETAADFVNLEPPISEELNAKVDARDKVQTGFKSGARAMMEMDDPEVRNAATILFELTHKHDLHTGMNMDAQTDAIRDFVTDVRENHLSLLAIVGLDVIFNKLDALNEEVCNLQKDRFVEYAEQERGVFAAARKRTDEAYKELIRGVNAYVFIQGNAAYAPFISFLNSIIIYYRRVHLKEKVDTAGEGGKPSDGEQQQPPTEGEQEEDDGQRTVTFTFANGETEVIKGEPGEALTYPANTAGYIWSTSDSNPSKIPAQNFRVIEVPDNVPLFTIVWFTDPTTPIQWFMLPVGHEVPAAPAAPAGDPWSVTVTVMPDHNLYILPESMAEEEEE